MRLRWLDWVSLVAIGAAFVASTAGMGVEHWRPMASYWLKHVPLCFAENAGLLTPRRAHYSAALGRTVDVLYCTPSKPPKLVGGPLARDLVVVSDMGGVVQRIDSSGRLLWQRRMSNPHGLDISRRPPFDWRGHDFANTERVKRH
jgi:hypothetical protein